MSCDSRLKKIADALIWFFYPRHCLHCDKSVPNPTHLLCYTCGTSIQWDSFSKLHRKNIDCLSYDVLCCFQPVGPIWSVYQDHDATNHGEVFAPFIVIFLLKRIESLPDLIFLPIYHDVWQQQLAKKTAKLLDIPMTHSKKKIHRKSVLILLQELTTETELCQRIQSLKPYGPEHILFVALFNRKESLFS